jgi:ketosteroid isomerase-like protein
MLRVELLEIFSRGSSSEMPRDTSKERLNFMKQARSQIFIGVIGPMVLMLLIPFIAAAQDAPKTEGSSQKQPTTTVDAWRNALPEKEQVAAPADDVANADVKAGAESFEQVEKMLNTLERKWMDAVKLHDAPALKRILADDFTMTSALSSNTTQDKTEYIETTLRDLQLKSYDFDKLNVRVYGEAALINATYKQEAVVSGKETSESFLLTDVWVRHDGHWRIVSRHTSQLASPR